MADDRGILFTAGPDVRCGQGFPSQNTQRPESFPAGQEPYPPQAHPGRNEENRTCPRHDPGYRPILHSIQCPAGRQAQHHAAAVLRHSDIHIITIHHQPVHQEKHLDYAKKVVEALGLRKMHQSVELQDNEMTRGAINKVPHLLTVEEL